MKREVVITAASFLNCPDLNSYNSVQNTTISSMIRKIPATHVEPYCPITKRLIRKIDGFCYKGLAVVNKALKESLLLETDPDIKRIGIYVGNCLGGWSHIEEEILSLHKTGIHAVGPYVATAWFPAALQGQISLHYGFLGNSKTFSNFDVAGMQAFIYGIQAIKLGLVDAVICCAGEDLSSSYVSSVLEKTVSSGWSLSQIFGSRKNLINTENAVAFVLEEQKHAIRRGAPILCKCVGSYDGFSTSSEQVRSLISSSIKEFVLFEEYPLFYMLDGRFSNERDTIFEVLKNSNIENQLIDISAVLGEQFSAGGLTDVALAAHSLKKCQLKASSFGLSDENKLYHQVAIQRLSTSGNITIVGLHAVND